MTVMPQRGQGCIALKPASLAKDSYLVLDKGSPCLNPPVPLKCICESCINSHRESCSREIHLLHPVNMKSSKALANIKFDSDMLSHLCLCGNHSQFHRLTKVFDTRQDEFSTQQPRFLTPACTEYYTSLFDLCWRW